MKAKEKIPVYNNLAKYRKWKNITQKELAENTNISYQIIGKIEREGHYPKYLIRKKLYEYFGVSPRQLFYVKEE